MKAWIVSLMAIIMALAVGCEQQPPVEQPPAQPIVSVYEEPTPTPAPTPEPTPEVGSTEYISPYNEKIMEAQAINPDVVGWISVPGTNIDFPILFGMDWYYSNRDINRELNTIGSIYAHLPNLATYQHYNTIQNLVIAGTNARLSRTLFHELHHVQEANIGKTGCAYERCGTELDLSALPDFSTQEGRTWDVSVSGMDGRWEIWAMYETASDEPQETLYYNTWFPQETSPGSGTRPFVPEDEAAVQEWINRQLERSQYDFPGTPTTADQFLTIYTGGDEHDAEGGARLYFFLKMVEPECEGGYWVCELDEAGEPAEPAATEQPESSPEPESPAEPESTPGAAEQDEAGDDGASGGE